MKMSSKFTCRFCKEQFDQPKGLYKHLQSAHSAGSSTDNRTCPICGVLCSKYEGYRDHLLYIHGQSNEGQKLTFKSLNEFLLWKTELEIKYQCKYVLQSAPKVLSSKEKKYFYQCDASSSKAKDKKNLSVVMKQCSSVISVVEGTGVFKVEYWDAHTGHAKAPQISVENELEAAISSVEMVNAIGESDDSVDQPEEITVQSDQASLENKKPVDKQPFFKTQSSSGLNNSTTTLLTPKTKTVQIIPKANSEKKKSSNMLFSLASVACGKGIVKKSSDKVNATKNNAVKTDSEKVKTVASPVKNKNGTVTLLSTPKSATEAVTTKTSTEPISAKAIVTSTDSKSTVAKTSPASKAAPSGPQAIAPKITSVTGNAVSPLFTTNSAFPNQLVIVNPVGIDPKSNQNISTAPQNIVLQLPLGSSILPSCSTPKPEKAAAPKPIITVDTKGSQPSKTNTTPGVAKTTNNVSKTVAKSAVKPLPNGTSPSLSKTASVSLTPVSTHTTVSLASGAKSTPIVLSSLPVGSTFMSVNNNLIPIATPSGTFLPTSLPPNIILTPVANSVSTAQSTSTVSSKIVQNQVCFSVSPSSSSVPAVNVQKDLTVSKPPKSSIKRTGSSSSTPDSSFKPLKILNKSHKPKPATISKISSPQKSTQSSIVPILNKFAALGELSITATPLPKNAGSKAKKRLSTTSLSPSLSRPVVKSNVPAYKKSVPSTVSIKSNKKPIKPFPNIAQHLNNPNIGNGTLLFESSGDIFMLEALDNSEVPNITVSKTAYSPPKSKVDRSVQTFENLASTMPRLHRKRTADPEDDAVMMKVKCYQLEMQYMNCKTECKQLKLELTKEKLKNAELTGEKVDLSNDETNEQSRNETSEILKEIEDKYSINKQTHVYTMTKTSVLRSLYNDLEELCLENSELHTELDNYRAHDKFYQSLKKKMIDEDCES